MTEYNKKIIRTNINQKDYYNHHIANRLIDPTISPKNPYYPSLFDKLYFRL